LLLRVHGWIVTTPPPLRILGEGVHVAVGTQRTSAFARRSSRLSGTRNVPPLRDNLDGAFQLGGATTSTTTTSSTTSSRSRRRSAASLFADDEFDTQPADDDANPMDVDGPHGAGSPPPSALQSARRLLHSSIVVRARGGV